MQDVIIFMLLNVGCTYNESPLYTSTYSETYNRTIFRHQWTSAGEQGHWYVRLNVPNIDRAVIDNGVVIVYYKNYITNNWIQIPYSTTLYNQYDQQFSEEIWFGYALGTLDIDYVYTNPLDMTPPETFELKIILLRF